MGCMSPDPALDPDPGPDPDPDPDPDMPWAVCQVHVSSGQPNLFSERARRLREGLEEEDFISFEEAVKQVG